MPSPIITCWTAADDLDDPSSVFGISSFTCSRSGAIGSKRDYNGVITSGIAANVRRDGDYRGIYPGRRGLLIEPTRENFAQYSEQIDNAYWNKYNLQTVSANGLVAPDGTTTAEYVKEDTADGYHYFAKAVAYTNFTSGGYIARSCFVKYMGNRANVAIGGADRDGSYHYFVFDVKEGRYLGHTNGEATYTFIEPCGYGWWRIGVVRTAGTGTNNVGMAALMAPNGWEQGDGQDGLYFVGQGGDTGLGVWGMQIENGYTITSYIKNDGAVDNTRNYDLLYSTNPNGTTNKACTIYTAFTDLGRAVNYGEATSRRIVQIGDTSTGNEQRLILYRNAIGFRMHVSDAAAGENAYLDYGELQKPVPAYGDLYEVVGWLYPNAKVQIAVAKNGGPFVFGTEDGPHTDGIQVFGSTTMRWGSAGSGATALDGLLHAFKYVEGNHAPRLMRVMRV